MQIYTIGKTRFDEFLCISLKKEVFLKLPLINKYVYSENNFEMLLKSLNAIHGVPIERVLDFISTTNDSLVKQFGKRILQEATAIYYSSVLWEWFYLLAYYVHQIDNDPQWQENYLPHIKTFQIRSIAIEEMEKGEKLIDQFIAKRKRVLEIQKQLQQPETLQNDTPDHTQQSEAKPPVFHIAENHKTDVIKVFSYMFDENLFVNADGSPLKRQKTQFMQTMGEVFGANFGNYARIINKAAQEPNFQGIFESMYMRSKNKYVYTK